MPSVPYSFHLTDAVSGAVIAADVEVDLDVKVDVEFGEPVVTVLAVYAGGNARRSDLLVSGDAIAKVLGQRIKALAERDPFVWERALEDAGVQYRGRGANDPAGRWVRGRAA